MKNWQLVIVASILLSKIAVESKTEIMPIPVSVTAQSNMMTVFDLRELVRQRKLAKENIDSAANLCAEVLEVPGAFLCFPTYQNQMNQIFTRIGIFWGTLNGFSPGTILNLDDPYLKDLNKVIDGHNLPGIIIENFFTSLKQMIPSPQTESFSEIEFQTNFVKLQKIQSLQGKYYLIATSVFPSKDYLTTIRHEIHHARYYLQPELRSALEEYWKLQVSLEDKVEVKKIFSAIYNVQNEQVVIDEFQAYILESEENSGILSKFAKSYRVKLLTFLKKQINYLPLGIH